MQFLAAIALFSFGVAQIAAQERLVPEGFEAPSIVISGAIEGRRVTLDAVDIANLPQHTVRVPAAGSRIVRFQGPLLQAVLELGGVRFGEALKGDRLASFLLVEGDTGERVVFALAELDETLTPNPVILATARDGRPLHVSEGRFRVVAAHEKKTARWVSRVSALRILHADYAIEEEN